MIGILLLNMGGPDSPGAVKPFLYNLFSDRDIIRLGPAFLQKPIASIIIALRLKKAIGTYGLIGGKSPLIEITAAQAKALEAVLSSSTVADRPSPGFTVGVGMRYWHPFVKETLEEMVRKGITKIIGLSLYPHYSVATTGSSVKEFEAVASRYPVEYTSITSWFDHPLYIDALAEKIREGMARFEKKPAVLFSAHSLPQKFVDAGDPYVQEIQGTVTALARKIDMEWYLSYQSKTGPVKWLEPTTEHMLHELANKGVRDLLVVPISFVSDHIETLYEIDILYREMAEGFGVENFRRTESLNTSPRFIEALAAIALQKAKEAGWA
ncbi:MAG: ferrochelatase [Nitrospirota bacterium]